MSNWLSVPLKTIAALTAALAPGIADAAPGDVAFTRIGQIVSADGAHLNLYCTGSGSPTVVLDAGHQDWAPAWAVIQPKIATWTRVCSFDRPGYGFSPARPMPRISEQIARELHGALHALGIGGPYVLVGHAFGGYNIRAFAYQYLPEVQGLVLIDTDAGDTASPEHIASSHHAFIRQAAQIQRCRDTLAAHSPSPPELSCDKRFFRGFPDPAWSDALNTTLSDAVHTRPDLFDTANAELFELPGDELYLRQHRRSLGSRPVRVITAAQHFSDTPDTPPEIRTLHERANREIIQAQAALLALSSNATQIFAYNSRNAYVPFDEPQLVLEAIAEAAGHRPTTPGSKR